MSRRPDVPSPAIPRRRAPRQRYFVIGGIVVGLLAGFLVQSVVPIAEIAFFAFALAAYLVADAAYHLIETPTFRRFLFYALFPPIALALLAATFAVTRQWAVAVLIALVVGGALQAALGALLFPTPRPTTTIR
ncbi:MAG: hypothetical protein RMM58_00075 [Chloroflexota bacterium]|nr:hypothetical protein [Dehalococcoidia bacterium]MDW8252258.1 hypothetical protein [Chloroflexota bacterium]